MLKSERACVYAALILADDDVAITAEKIQTILKTAGVEVEPYWPGLFAKALQNCNVKDLITNIGSGSGHGSPNSEVAKVAADRPSDKERKDEEKEDSEPSDDEDPGLFGLFD